MRGINEKFEKATSAVKIEFVYWGSLLDAHEFSDSATEFFIVKTQVKWKLLEL